MTLYFYNATEGPEIPTSELINLPLDTRSHIRSENVIHEHLDRNVPALLRPKLARLVCDENAGHTVICGSLESLGQNAHEILATVAKFRSCRIHLYCSQISEQVNLIHPKGEIVLASINAYAKLLTTVQGSRVRIGQEKMRSQGVTPGRRVELSEETQKKILLLISQGHTISEIVLQLGTNRWAVGRAIKRANPTLPEYVPNDVAGSSNL